MGAVHHLSLLFSLIISIALIDFLNAEIVQVIDEADVLPSSNDEASGRFFGGFGNFDALAYKENLLHNKISFLFSLIPRPNKWNIPPYPGFGAYPGGPLGVVPGYPAGYPNRPIPPYGPGVIPGAVPGIVPGSLYPGGFNPYYPGLPAAGGGFLPGVLPVVAENNTNPPSGGGNKPSQSASVAVTTKAPPPASAAEDNDSGGDSAPPAEEESKQIVNSDGGGFANHLKSLITPIPQISYE